jgi:Zn-dependent M28 family amino/carboxypeptidase
MHDAALSERLRTHVEVLAGIIGERNVSRPRALQAAADYIAQTWRDQGYEVIPISYPVDGVHCANLEITRRGIARPRDILLIGAHYDSVTGSPGANDNASGVAALLEISAHCARLSPASALRFVAFVNEEPPYFFRHEMGSLVYARAARKRGDRIRLMMSLEMLGCYRDEPGSQHYPPLFRYFFPSQGNFVAFVSNLRSRAALRRVVRAFRSHSDFPVEHLSTLALVPGVAWSDHLSFWRQGYRALMVTDTAFYRYPYYHSPGDTADKLDYASFSRVTAGLQRAIASLADDAF